MRANRENNPRFKIIFAMFAQRKVAFPFEGEENCKQFGAAGDG